MDFKSELNKRVTIVENIMNKYIRKEEGYQKKVIEAMNYTLRGGGKRLRPILMLESYHLFGGDEEIIEPFMMAMEMIHTYSLVHDDLPALDNDNYRRGKKTAHMIYGEAMAILAGDALLNEAFAVACKSFSMEHNIANERLMKAMTILANKPSIDGMIGGQVADVLLTGKNLTKDELIFIYKNKTGALIEGAMMIGAILAGASDKDVAKIEKIASYVGMAFQIQDDILDVTSTTEDLGKPVGSDERNNKTTYVSIYGLDKAKKKVNELSKKAVSLVEEYDNFNYDNDFLIELILYLIHRKY